jgi:hypothetical protein
LRVIPLHSPNYATYCRGAGFKCIKIIAADIDGGKARYPYKSWERRYVSTPEPNLSRK